MTYVITEPCIGVKDKSCVSVCPSDCIHEGIVEQDGITFDMLFIDPVACIDCGLCEPECPVSAIFADSDVPKPWQHFVEINANFYRKE
jgi:ferredoxin